MSRLGLVGSAGRGQVPGGHRHIPQLVVADRQVPLPLRVGRVGGGQPHGDVQAGLVGSAGRGQVPGGHRHIPQLFVADRQVPLPLRVGRVGGGQPHGDVQAGLVGSAGRGQVAGGHRHIPQLVVADRQVPLPLAVGRVGGGAGFDVVVDCLELPGGCGQVTSPEQGLYLEVGDEDPGSLGGGDQGADLSKVGNCGEGSGQDPDGLVGDAGDVVVAAEGGEVAGDVNQVVVAATMLLESAEPHGQCLFMLSAEVAAGVAGDQPGGPGMHRDVVAGSEQGQVLQPLDIGAQRRQARLGGRTGSAGAGGEGEGEIVEGHRGAADRDLGQHLWPGGG